MEWNPQIKRPIIYAMFRKSFNFNDLRIKGDVCLQKSH